MKQQLLDSIRSVLPKPLKQALKRLLGRPLTALHTDWAILSLIGPVNGDHVVLDLGARNGWFFQCWREWCPRAQVHAFEPDAAAFSDLHSKYADEPAVTLSQYGVGEVESVETFYCMSESRVSSSFLQHNEDTWRELQYATGEIETKQLSVTTLDAYCSEHQIGEIYLIKIDIQGYELKALRGAMQTLRHTRHILVESSIRPLYEGGARFTEVHEFLAQHGFHLMNLRAWHRGNGVLMETDMLFRRDDLAGAISMDADQDRYYINV